MMCCVTQYHRGCTIKSDGRVLDFHCCNLGLNLRFVSLIIWLLLVLGWLVDILLV